MDNLVDQAVDQVAKQIIRTERAAFKDAIRKITDMDVFLYLPEEDQKQFKDITDKLEANLIDRCKAEARQKVLQSIIKNVEV